MFSYVLGVPPPRKMDEHLLLAKRKVVFLRHRVDSVTPARLAPLDLRPVAGRDGLGGTRMVVGGPSTHGTHERPLDG